MSKHRNLLSTSKRGLCHKPALDVSSESQTSEDVLRFQVRKIRQYLLLRHTGRQITENIVDGDPHSPNARLATSHIGVDRYALPVIHTLSLRYGIGRFKKQYRVWGEMGHLVSCQVQGELDHFALGEDRTPCSGITLSVAAHSIGEIEHR